MDQKPTSKIDSQEAINRIKEAEAEAERVIRAAREQESLQILQEVQEEIKKHREGRLAEAGSLAKKQIQTRVQKAEAEAQEIRERAEVEVESLRKAASGLIPDAVAKTVTKISDMIQKRLG